jgi:hypothetical protein
VLSAGFVGDEGLDDPEGRPWNASRGGPENGVVDTVDPARENEWAGGLVVVSGVPFA